MARVQAGPCDGLVKGPQVRLLPAFGKGQPAPGSWVPRGCISQRCISSCVLQLGHALGPTSGRARAPALASGPPALESAPPHPWPSAPFSPHWLTGTPNHPLPRSPPPLTHTPTPRPPTHPPFLQRVSNVVFMGMGEPLLNLPSVMRAHDILNKDIGIGGLDASAAAPPSACPSLPRSRACRCPATPQQPASSALPPAPAPAWPRPAAGTAAPERAARQRLAGGAMLRLSALVSCGAGGAAPTGAAPSPPQCTVKCSFQLHACPRPAPAGARHITISTVGVPNAIQRMGRLQLQSTLAVSIHAPNQVGGGGCQAGGGAAQREARGCPAARSAIGAGAYRAVASTPLEPSVAAGPPLLSAADSAGADRAQRKGIPAGCPHG